MRLEDAIKVTDVLYVTRIQKERFASEVRFEPTATTTSVLFDFAADAYVLCRRSMLQYQGLTA
jgi:aspartate carbamoyltransferase catalytic subunit